MSAIREGNGICTQITTVKLRPDTQHEVLRLMKERAKFMATQSGFISVNLHRVKTGPISSTMSNGPARESSPRRIIRQNSGRIGRSSANW
jgi:hypothetical protein